MYHAHIAVSKTALPTSEASKFWGNTQAPQWTKLQLEMKGNVATKSNIALP